MCPDIYFVSQMQILKEFKSNFSTDNGWHKLRNRVHDKYKVIKETNSVINVSLTEISFAKASWVAAILSPHHQVQILHPFHHI